MKATHNSLFVSSLIALLLSIGGCATSSYGTKIDPNKISQIKKGTTTRAEVMALFGAPMNVSIMGDGRRVMSYTYSDTSMQTNGATFIPIVGMFAGGATGQQKIQTLQIMLNKNGVVDDFEFSDQNNAIQSNYGVFGGTTTTTQAAPQK